MRVPPPYWANGAIAERLVAPIHPKATPSAPKRVEGAQVFGKIVVGF
jgi:hypothetical protein